MFPKGPFNLLHQNQYFNGWPNLKDDDQTIVMAFPVEKSSDSAAVTLKQNRDNSLDLKVYGTSEVELATQQSLASLSLDEDGTFWEEVGKKDSIIQNLQLKYEYMRPTLFHSPYEAAAAFIIGHRISITQARKIRSALADEIGEKIKVGNEFVFAFPHPRKLLSLEEFKGLNETKIIRLRDVAKAALDGILDREYLRSLNDEEALLKLETIPGIGPFFSQGILYRGVGIKDGFTRDDMTFHAIKAAYNLKENATEEEILEIAKKWQPYRMWAIVLLHVWIRETGNLPNRTFSKK
jgi:DNA-3-methyladenine glycosylase II